jgi:hypothetical protein
MAGAEQARPRVLVDADALFAGAAGPNEYGASLVILRITEITLIKAVTCQQVIDEVERNLTEKMPAAMPAFRLLVSRCLQVVPTPTETEAEPYQGLAHDKDLPVLVIAAREQCPMLVTFNQRHFNQVTRPLRSCFPVISSGEHGTCFQICEMPSRVGNDLMQCG